MMHVGTSGNMKSVSACVIKGFSLCEHMINQSKRLGFSRGHEFIPLCGLLWKEKSPGGKGRVRGGEANITQCILDRKGFKFKNTTNNPYMTRFPYDYFQLKYRAHR